MSTGPEEEEERRSQRSVDDEAAPILIRDFDGGGGKFEKGDAAAFKQCNSAEIGDICSNTKV